MERLSSNKCRVSSIPRPSASANQTPMRTDLQQSGFGGRCSLPCIGDSFDTFGSLLCTSNIGLTTCATRSARSPRREVLLISIAKPGPSRMEGRREVPKHPRGRPPLAAEEKRKEAGRGGSGEGMAGGGGVTSLLSRTVMIMYLGKSRATGVLVLVATYNGNSGHYH